MYMRNRVPNIVHLRNKVPDDTLDSELDASREDNIPEACKNNQDRHNKDLNSKQRCSMQVRNNIQWKSGCQVQNTMHHKDQNKNDPGNNTC